MEGGGEAAVTLSEVPEARLECHSQTLLDVTRLAAGRVAPHHPLADCSITSSMGGAAMEANVHLLCMKGIEQRYNVPFDAAAVTIYAPIPQFRAGLAEQAGCTDGVLSEVERAKLLVIVGGDGRLVYAGTGDPIGPSSAHDAPCAHMFVALASGGEPSTYPLTIASSSTTSWRATLPSLPLVRCSSPTDVCTRSTTAPATTGRPPSACESWSLSSGRKGRRSDRCPV